MKAYSESKTPIPARDKRGTPPGLVALVEEILGIEFTLDVCAEPHTAQTDAFYSDKALVRVWAYDVGSNMHTSRLPAAWMNPPYSAPYPWIEKAVLEAQRGCVTVALLPDDRSTKWYRELVKPYASAMLVTDRRIPFLDENGAPQFGNPKGSIIPVFAPWRLGWIEQTLHIPDDLMKQWRRMAREDK